jgi:kanamycin kinase
VTDVFGTTAVAPDIPAGALAGMAGWEATLAWSLVPERTTWRLRAPAGEVRYLKVYHLSLGRELAAERERLNWALPCLPVPRVLAYGMDSEREWLLTAGMPGVTGLDASLGADPARLVRQLGEGLRQLHALPVDSCPFDHRLDKEVDLAERRVAAGLVDAQEFNADHRDLTPETALTRLQALRPAREDLVVCHGDYCVPNVLFENGRVSGYVDLGHLGVADRWRDLAVATWSVTWNLGPGWEDLFLAAYGARRDPQKQAFYRLLYDLLP